MAYFKVLSPLALRDEIKNIDVSGRAAVSPSVDRIISISEEREVSILKHGGRVWNARVLRRVGGREVSETTGIGINVASHEVLG